MNRPGQPPQRPPSLAPNPGLPGQFRGPYPQYGLPPRNVNVLQTNYVPGIQPNNHRTSTQPQNMLLQPSPGLFQQNRQNNFPFGTGILQSGQSQQHQSSTTLQQPANSLQQTQQANGNSMLPSHLTQSATTPSLPGTAPSVSSASEVGLDPNDFPALGSSAVGNSTASALTSNATGGSSNIATSYASQAGTGLGTVAAGSGSGGGNSNIPRDFTPDDFPALGGQSTTQALNPISHGQPSQNQNQDNHSLTHPPGLNGFQQNDHSQQQQQHRQTLLGSLSGQQSNTPGMLNLGPSQARSIHAGFQQTQSEAEKQRNYALKLNQASHAAWNSPGTNAPAQANPFSSTALQNGTHQTQGQTQNSLQSQSHLNAPPGVPPPSAPFAGQQHQPSSATVGGGAIGATAAPYTSNGLPLTLEHHHPQTPAQQVLMSAADRWGLLGLLAMIKSVGSDADGGLSSIGTDLGTMGLDMGYAGNLYSTFITPWADQSAAHSVEPDFHLPACYNVQPAPPGPTKAAAFSDETLFFMFYSSPRDALQEVAAQELWNRNWRYHKDLRLWITKESGTTPSQKVPGGEQGTYTYWDPENWAKERKEMTVLYSDLEEKSVPVFVQGPGLVLAQQPQAQTQPNQQGQVQQQVQQQRTSFQMGMAGL